MSYQTLEKIRHNGKSYGIGEEISDLTHEQAKRLLDLGVIEGELIAEPKLPITPEEFNKLGATEQKGLLKFHEIEAAGKEEDRISQYATWYAENVTV